MTGENVIQVIFGGKEITDYVARGEHAVAWDGKLCSETLGNAVVGIVGSKGAGLANVNNVSELEALLRQVKGSARIIGPRDSAENARKYLAAKGIEVAYMFPSEGYVIMDATTGHVVVDEPSITDLTQRPGSTYHFH